MPLIAATGLTGFLGAHLRPVLEREGFTVENISRDARRSLGELQRFLAEREPAAMIHMAGLVDVRRCQAHPFEAFQAHVAETANLLEAIRITRPQTPFLYVASDKSFGEQQDCGLAAFYKAGPPYETSKACEDLLVESYRTTYALPICLLRFPNFFGPGDRHLERLVPSVCNAAALGTELVIRTRLDGSVRQFIYVYDAARIVSRCATAMIAREPVWPANHFGPRHIKTVGDVIGDIENILGRKLSVRVLNLPGEVSRLSLRDENFLGYPYSDWLPALRQTLEWYVTASHQWS